MEGNIFTIDNMKIDVLNDGRIIIEMYKGNITNRPFYRTVIKGSKQINRLADQLEKAGQYIKKIQMVKEL